MPSKVSTVTMESEGYSPEDWIPILEKFEDLKVLEPERPDHLSLEDYLLHGDNQTGGNPSYRVKDGIGVFNLDYSPYLRSEHEVMLRGSLSLNQNEFDTSLKDASITPLSIVISDISHRSAMLYGTEADLPDELPEIAYIEIPENHQEEKVDLLIRTLTIWMIGIYRTFEGSADTETEREIRELLE